MEETIVAISTAPGSSGIGIVRLSGKNSFKILEKIFKPKNNSKIKGYSIKYGSIIDENKNIVDEVLVSYFLEPIILTFALSSILENILASSSLSCFNSTSII